MRRLARVLVVASSTLAWASPVAAQRASPASALPAALGLPAMHVPPGHPMTPAKVALGRKLFGDRRLSPNGTMSYAMCHVPEQGFTAHEVATPVGFAGRSVRRNAPTVLNVAWQKRLMHDGREGSLENQPWGPLLAPNEMGNPSIGAVVARVAALEDYRGAFEAAYAGGGPSAARIGAALAAYQRTLVAADSRFDRWRFGGDDAALTALEKAGFALFAGKGRCTACHRVGERDALFTDDGFHNTGVGWRVAAGVPDRVRVELAPGVYAELDRGTVASFGEPPPKDDGRYEVTLEPKDRWAYKTPSLRNVALTPPYMHDGSFDSLEAVVAFYDRGGIDNPQKSPLVAALGLSADERAALVAFLRTLTGSGVDALAADARTAASATARCSVVPGLRCDEAAR